MVCVMRLCQWEATHGRWGLMGIIYISHRQRTINDKYLSRVTQGSTPLVFTNLQASIDQVATLCH